MATFSEIYEQIPKREAAPTERTKFIRRIADATKKSEQTVKNWLSGRQRPDALTQSVIAKVLKVPADELFPTEERKEAHDEK